MTRICPLQSMEGVRNSTAELSRVIPHTNVPLHAKGLSAKMQLLEPPMDVLLQKLDFCIQDTHGYSLHTPTAQQRSLGGMDCT